MRKWTVPKLAIVAVGLLIVLSACALNHEAMQTYNDQRQVPMQLPPFSGTWLTQSGVKLVPYMAASPREPWQQVESRPALGGTLEPYAPATSR